MECPVCHERMKHQKIESIHADVCEEHGIWLDKGEVEAIMESSKRKGEAEAFVKSMWDHTHH